MKLGSLFDGSGGFPLAGAICGIEPVWASEVESYPIRVTTERFPNMRHLGDITKLSGGEMEPVDVITFGSPCQDLSVAGKRAGIHDGERSSLFFHAIRIIREMREATNGVHPRIIVWENVHGAYSSNGGEDFRAVLQAICEIADTIAHVPRPAKKWGVQGASWGTGTAWHGEPMTLSIGECPSVAVESTLSQILEANAPEKYTLSRKACAGILRRSLNRGKHLPYMLLEAIAEALLD